MISVCIPTWPNSAERLEYFERTVAALRVNLTATGHDLAYVASSEAQNVPRDFAQELLRLCQKYRVRLSSRPPLAFADLGANMNAALRMGLECRPSHVLFTQDDWRLMEPLDLRPYCDALDELNASVGMIRFGWSSNPDHTRMLGIMGHRVSDPATPGKMLEIQEVDANSSYFYADHPQLRRATFPNEYGWFTQGGNMGGPEFDMNRTIRQKRWQIGASHKTYFEHCGTKSTTEDHYAIPGDKAAS